MSKAEIFNMMMDKKHRILGGICGTILAKLTVGLFLICALPM